MIHQIVCLLLIPALLANQAAMCCAHSHSDSESDDHSVRSHFHVTGAIHTEVRGDHLHDGHQHGDHQHGDHQHGDCGSHDDSGEPSPDGADANLDFAPSCPVGHDGDAVFFGEQNNIQISSSRITLEDLTFISVCFVAALPRVETRVYRTQVSRVGPFWPCQCAIILQTGCLLI